MIIKKSKEAYSHLEFLYKDNLLNSKRSQVTLFVILAIAIVIIIVLLFLSRGDLASFFNPESPLNQIRQCIQEPVQEAVEILRLQGGSLNPENYYLYKGNKVDYLCYTGEYYSKCLMQKPLLKQSIEKEIKEYAEPKIENCINSVKISLEKKRYSVSMKNPEISISLVPKNIIIETDLDLRIEKEGVESYKNIKTDIFSNLYDQVMIASSIANWEAHYGDSETMTYMMYYPSLKVEKKKQGEGTTVYILTDRDSKDKFIFASRSVVLPAGLTGQ